MVLDSLPVPFVQAPMAGGTSTPELAAAVAAAGGLGFVAAGYRSVPALRSDIQAVRSATGRPFGVNLFLPTTRGDAALVAAYAERVREDAAAHGLPLGEPRWTDDEYPAKLELVLEERPAAVSFTFGCPAPAAVAALHDAGIEAWVTVTEPAEAQAATAAGADVLVVQGSEAGAHRGSFSDEDGAGELGLLPLLRLVASVTDRPLVASGGIGDGRAAAAALAAGAAAIQVGTALMGVREAGTSVPHREALRKGGRTALTRAFSGRRARGLVNGFLARHQLAAPSAYPEVHYLTAPMRAAARERGDLDHVNLWAGQAHGLMQFDVPAADVVARFDREIREAVEGLSRRFS